jgi:hypothetical protein
VKIIVNHVVCSTQGAHRIGNIPVLSPQLDRLTEYGQEMCCHGFYWSITMSNGQTTVMTMDLIYMVSWTSTYITSTNLRMLLDIHP